MKRLISSSLASVGLLLSVLAPDPVWAAQAAPSGPILTFALNSACEDLADELRLSLGLRQAALLSDIAVGERPVTELESGVQEQEAFLQDYAGCLDKQDDYEKALQNPGTSSSAAKSEYDAAIAELARHANLVSSSVAHPFDEAIDQSFRDRYAALLKSFREGQTYLRSAEPLRIELRNQLDKELQLSVDCRIYGKSIDLQDRARGCNQVLALDASKFVADFSVRLGAVAPAIAYLGTELEAASVAQQAAISQSTSYKVQMDGQIKQMSAYAASMSLMQQQLSQLGAAGQATMTLMQNLNGIMQQLQATAGWAYSTAYWHWGVCNQYVAAAYYYWGIRGYKATGDWYYAAAPLWLQVGNVYWHQYYLPVAQQQIPTVTAQLSQLQAQSQQITAQATALQSSMQGTANAIAAGNAAIKGLTSSISTIEAKIQEQSSRVGAIKQGIVSSYLEVKLSDAAASLKQGLQGLWHLDEAKPLDSSGKNNHGAAYGTSSDSAGRFGGALAFNGTTSFAQVPTSTSLNIGAGGKLSLSAWIRPTGAGFQPILEFGDTSSIGVQLWQFNAADRLYANLVDTKGQPHMLMSRAGALKVNVWNHVAMTYDGATAVLYVNGLPVELEKGYTNQVGSFTPWTARTLNIGYRPYSAGSYRFKGSIDQVGAWNRALSAAEVKEAYTSGVSEHGNCLAASCLAIRLSGTGLTSATTAKVMDSEGNSLREYTAAELALRLDGASQEAQLTLQTSAEREAVLSAGIVVSLSNGTMGNDSVRVSVSR